MDKRKTLMRTFSLFFVSIRPFKLLLHNVRIGKLFQRTRIYKECLTLCPITSEVEQYATMMNAQKKQVKVLE